MSSILWSLASDAAPGHSQWWGLTQVTPPVGEPVPLDVVRAHLRVDSNFEDDSIAGYNSAAREYIEGACGRAMLQQQFDLWLGRWPAGNRLYVPFPPLISIDWVKYTDSTEMVSVADPATYTVNSSSDLPEVVLRTGQIWPSASLSPSRPVNVRFTCGYPTLDGSVTVAGAVVTKVSGASFLPGMKRLVIAGATYRVASVDSLSQITLAAVQSISGTQPYTANLVPERLVQAILMLTGHWYQNREEVVVGRTSTIATDVPDSVSALIRRFKMDTYTPDPLRS